MVLVSWKESPPARFKRWLPCLRSRREEIDREESSIAGTGGPITGYRAETGRWCLSYQEGGVAMPRDVRTGRREPFGEAVPLAGASIWRRYSYGWITGLFFVFTIAGHWIFGWFAYVDEQQSLGAAISVSGYAIDMGRDTLENWQSEFLQLLWQVGGLAYFLYVGSPQSEESDQRHEEKLDAILRAVQPDKAEEILRGIERRLGRL
jgi:hypothetical protein